VDAQALHETLRRFAETLTTDYGPVDVLYELCEAMTRVLEVSGAGIMLVDEHDGALRFVAASDETVHHIEHLQVELDEGPCLRSARAGEVVQVPDLKGEHDFPRFGPRALEHGMRGVFSFPMQIGDRRIGAVNVYRSEVVEPQTIDTPTGLLLANIATAYLVNAENRQASARMIAQLQEALDSRIVIEQAKGLLAERHAEELSEAFERLRRHARSTQTRLHLVAAEVVAGRLDP
jgi:hypothetical protein